MRFQNNSFVRRGNVFRFFVALATGGGIVFGLLGCQLLQPQNQTSERSSVDRPQERLNSGGPGPAASAAIPVETSAALRQRLLVLPFLDANEKHPESLRMSAKNQFVKELVRTQQVVVVDSRDVNFNPEEFIKKSEYESSKLASKVNALGIPVAMEGKILSLRVRRSADEVGVFRQVKSVFEAQVRVRLISSRSGKDLFNTTRRVSVQESGIRVAENASVEELLRNDPELLERLVSDAFMDFFPQIRSTLEKLSWEGRIAAIQGQRFFLNVGKESGLKVGDLLRVSEDGEDIFDPQTGSFIGKASGRVKGTLEVVGYFGHDGSIGVVHSGSGFRENDKVEVY